MKTNPSAIFVLIMSIMAVLGSGCIQTTKETAVTPTQTPILATTPNITVTPISITASEIPNVTKLKIMSVTTGQTSVGGALINVKVKNIGDGIAKDVYVGGINVYFFPLNGTFPNKTELLIDGIMHLLSETVPAGLASYSIDTGIPNPGYNKEDIHSNNGVSEWENLTVQLNGPEGKDYIGDILPGEVKEGHVDRITYSTITNYSFVKIAWAGDTKEFVIW